MKISIDGRGINLYKGSGIGTYTENVLKELINLDNKNEYTIFTKILSIFIFIFRDIGLMDLKELIHIKKILKIFFFLFLTLGLRRIFQIHSM